MRCRGVDTKAKTGGLAVTLIDFTLSRLTMPGAAVAFCDLSADPELFAGPKGDCQVPPNHIRVPPSHIRVPP